MCQIFLSWKMLINLFIWMVEWQSEKMLFNSFNWPRPNRGSWNSYWVCHLSIWAFDSPVTVLVSTAFLDKLTGSWDGKRVVRIHVWIQEGIMTSQLGFFPAGLGHPPNIFFRQSKTFITFFLSSVTICVHILNKLHSLLCILSSVVAI